MRGWMIWRVQYVENHGCRTTAFYRKDYEGVAGKLAPSEAPWTFVVKIILITLKKIRCHIYCCAKKLQQNYVN